MGFCRGTVPAGADGDEGVGGNGAGFSARRRAEVVKRRCCHWQREQATKRRGFASREAMVGVAMGKVDGWRLWSCELRAMSFELRAIKRRAWVREEWDVE